MCSNYLGNIDCSSEGVYLNMRGYYLPQEYIGITTGLQADPWVQGFRFLIRMCIGIILRIPFRDCPLHPWRVWMTESWNVSL